MPGVRYGPDITDDAAQMLNDIMIFKALKKEQERGRLKKVDANVKKRHDRAVKNAKQLFGLTDRDIAAGRYKDLKIAAEYGADTRNDPEQLALARKYGKVYKRGKLARNKRTGNIMKRSAMEEGRRQTLFDKKPTGRTYLARTRSGLSKKRPGDRATIEAGGLTYLGRTNTKRLRAVMDRLDRRMARNNRKGGVISDRGGKRTKIRKYAEGGKSDIARLNIAKQRKQTLNKKTGKFKTRYDSVRGRRVALPKSASAKRAKSAQAKRKSTVKKAGRKTNVGRGKKKTR